jgi:CDP-diacylglycerol--glycerol-3-phosphate 3-phosphatidyltransferase
VGWANRITVARAGLTVAVWVLAAFAAAGDTGAWWWVFWAFVVTAVTDALDGAVARHLNQVSVFGRIADPLVDKLLVLGTITVLLPVSSVREVLPPWVALVVLVRELLVTALRAAVESQGASFQAQFWGKLKMWAQCAAVGAAVLFAGGVAWLHERPAVLGGRPVALLFAWAAALVTAISALDYVRRAMRLLRGPGPA